MAAAILHYHLATDSVGKQQYVNAKYQNKEQAVGRGLYLSFHNNGA
jgi:hypothetical protein